MKEKTGGGVGFLGLLTLLFIALKLMGYINWPWLWVLSPLWIPVAGFLGFMGLCLVMAIASMLFLAWLDRK